jgi:O-antigen ligase
MNILSLFTGETLIILEALFIGVIILSMSINRYFSMGIYVWLLSILFFKYERIRFIGSILPDISIDRVLFVFLVTVFILEVMIRKRRLFNVRGIECAMFLFCLAAVLSMIWSGLIVKEGGRLRIGQLLTGYIFPFSMFFIGQHVYDNPRKREGFIKFVILVGLYLGLTALFEHFNIDRLIWPRYIIDPSYGIHFGRARGPFGQAALNGTVLGFVFIASIYFLFNPKINILWKVISLILLTLSPLAIFFTYTRAVWLAGCLGFVATILFFFRYKKKAVVVTLLVLCIAVFFSIFFLVDEETIVFALARTNAKQPVYDRLNLYIASMNMYLHNPLFGVGFGKFQDLVSGYYTNVDSIRFQNEELSEHDTFVGVLTEMGTVGILLVLYVYFAILSKSRSLYRYLTLQNPEGPFLVYIFWGVGIVFLVNAIFIDMRYSEFINSLFFIFAGIICGWERRCNEKIF